MLKKIVVAAVAVSTSVLFFAACGGDDCTDASDRIAAKYKSCGVTATSSSSSSSSSSQECTADLGKKAQAIAACTESASCDALTGKDTAGATTFAKCVLDAAGSGGTTSGGTTGATTSSTGTGG
jgi:hypothetical protein